MVFNWIVTIVYGNYTCSRLMAATRAEEEEEKRPDIVIDHDWPWRLEEDWRLAGRLLLYRWRLSQAGQPPNILSGVRRLV